MPPFTLPDNISPDSIDTLTELNAILARLRKSAVTNPLSVSHSGLTNLNIGNTPATANTPLPAGATSTPGAMFAAPGGVLDFKDLPAATDNLKHKLRRAREAVKMLPDLERDLDAQDKEIALLEKKKAMQIAELLRIKQEGEQFAKAEQNKPEEGDKMMT